MLTALRRLGLEAKRLGRARTFYEERLGLQATNVDETGSASCVTYAVGATTLVLRRPTERPRGGVHTHYAFSTTPAAYQRWLRRLADLDPVAFSFGSSDSLYVYDPVGHCVEIGSVDRDKSGDSAGGGTTDAPPLSGTFEVVLEVADLPRAEARYRRLGFEVADRGEERRRIRLSGPVALELWEPQLGIADARGGLHVDLAFATPNPDAVVEAGAPWPDGPEPVDGGLRVVDDDGHVLTFLAETA
jgi:catechol-2,3-dioxygenase